MASSSEIHGRLDHPVIDSDGHMAEYLPTLTPYLEREGLSLGPPVVPPPAAPVQRVPGPVARAHRPRSGPSRDAARPVVGLAGQADDRSRHRAASRAAVRAARRDSASTSAWCTRASACVFLHTAPTTSTGAARAAPSTAATPRRSRPRRPPDAGRRHPDAHARRGDRRARVRGRATLGFKAVLLAGYVQRPVDALAGKDPEVARTRCGSTSSARQRVRLRPGVGQVPGARRVASAFHSGFIGMAPYRVDLELHVQPPRRCSPRASSRLPSRCSSAASPAASRRCNFAFLEGGVAGLRRSTATSSATGRSATSRALAGTSTRRLVDLPS